MEVNIQDILREFSCLDDGVGSDGSLNQIGLLKYIYFSIKIFFVPMCAIVFTYV